jgi:hypothetical protein
VEFDTSELLRGDFKSMMDGFAVGKQWGFYSTNTVLAKLGENPIGPEGDILWCPVNMQNAARLLDTEPIQDQPIGGGPVTPAQRSLFDSYIPVMTGLFKDAVGRVTTRSKRDVESVSLILRPVLETITSIVVAEARSQFTLSEDWEPSSKVLHDYLKGVATRAAHWTAENRDQIVGGELTRAIRAIHIGIYREAGAAVALKEFHE